MVLSDRVKNEQKKEIKRILENGLKKKVLVSNMDAKHTGCLNNVLECSLDYDVEELSNFIIECIDRFGNVVKLTNGGRLKKKAIYLDSSYEKSYLNCQTDDNIEVKYSSYLCYPEAIDAFLKYLEGLNKTNSVLDNNSILGGFEEDVVDNSYINFDNSFNVNLEDCNNYVCLRYIIGLIKMKNLKLYNGENKDLINSIDFNDFILRTLPKTYNVNDYSKNVSKHLVRKKKINE